MVAIPVMLRGMAANPLTGSAGLCRVGAALMGFTWYGLRPDCRAERVGLQYWVGKRVWAREGVGEGVVRW